MVNEGFRQLSEKIQLSFVKGGLALTEMSEGVMIELENIKRANREVSRIKRVREIQTKNDLDATLDVVKTHLEFMHPTEARVLKPQDILEPSLVAWKNDQASHYQVLRFITDDKDKDVKVEMTRQALSGETIEPLISFIYQPYRDEMIFIGKDPSVDPMKPWNRWSLMDKALAAIDLAQPVSNNFFQNLVR